MIECLRMINLEVLCYKFTMMLTDTTETSLRKALSEDLLFPETLPISAWIAMANVIGMATFSVTVIPKFVNI